MKTYRVNIAVRVLETYEVEAESAEEAAESWCWGELARRDDEALDTELLAVKEVDRARIRPVAETSACQAADSVACSSTVNEGDAS